MFDIGGGGRVVILSDDREQEYIDLSDDDTNDHESV